LINVFKSLNQFLILTTLLKRVYLSDKCSECKENAAFSCKPCSAYFCPAHDASVHTFNVFAKHSRLPYPQNKLPAAAQPKRQQVKQAQSKKAAVVAAAAAAVAAATAAASQAANSRAKSTAAPLMSGLSLFNSLLCVALSCFLFVFGACFVIIY
jgi:hypothetical protein